MTNFRTLALALTLAGTAALPTEAKFSSIVVLGDSLSDTGNIQIAVANLNAQNVGQPGFPIADPTPAAAGYFNGRFSNGLIYVDFLNQRLTTVGGVSKPYLATVAGAPGTPGLNFAFGGAKATTDADGIPDLTEQRLGIPNNSATPTLPGYIQYATALGLPLPDPNALYLVSIGNNDAREIANAAIQGRPATVSAASAAQSVALTIQALYQGGVKHVALMGSFDLGTEPVFAGNATPATNASAAVNAAINQAVFGSAVVSSGTRNLGGGRFLTYFDAFEWTQQVVANPAAFGLPANLNVTTPCFLVAQANASVLPDCSGFAWADGIHPTSAVHQALANSLFPLLQQNLPEPGMLALFGLGAVALGARRRRAA
jgi:outer membrane lipase/esterase